MLLCVFKWQTSSFYQFTKNKINHEISQIFTLDVIFLRIKEHAKLESAHWLASVRVGVCVCVLFHLIFR